MEITTTDPKSTIFKTTDGKTVFLMKPGQTERARCTCMTPGCAHVQAVVALLGSAKPVTATATAKQAPQSKPAMRPAPQSTVAAQSTPKAETPEQVAAQMRTLVAKMAADAGLDVQVVFRNKQGSYHRTLGPKRHILVFGWQCLTTRMEKGFFEYKSLTWILKGESPKGAAAGKWLAMHEFAHCLQCEIPGGRTRGSVHNATFVKCYLDVLKTYNS